MKCGSDSHLTLLLYNNSKTKLYLGASPDSNKHNEKPKFKDKMTKHIIIQYCVNMDIDYHTTQGKQSTNHSNYLTNTPTHLSTCPAS